MTVALGTTDHILPAWLTTALQRKGYLSQGHVLAIDARPNPAFNSVTTHLVITYSHDAPESAPHQLLLKRNLQADWARPAGIRETQFYQMVAQMPDHPAVIVPCIDAAYDPSTQNSHVLLIDLSTSHRLPLTREQQINLASSVPAREDMEQVIDTLAQIHAYWWQHPQLGTGIAQIGAWCRTEAAMVQEIARRQQAWDDLWQHEQAWLPTSFRHVYESILHTMMALWRNYTYPRLAYFTNFTLTHGDCYFPNFLCPAHGTHGTTYLFDWQSPEVYRGTGDLVNLLATFWTRGQRADHEHWLLQRYHAGLQQHGVLEYSWEALVADYQYSILDWLLNTLQDRLDGAPRSYWYTKMQCLMDAFEDWDCTSLIL